MQEVKQCSKCGKILPLSEFQRDRSKSSGYASWCKDCKNKSKRLSRNKIKPQQNKIKPNKKTYTVPDGCPGCMYHRCLGNSDTTIRSCHYLLDTGHSRLKECGKGVCTVRKERNSSEAERKKNDFLF